jgi:hypothetical protein
MQMIRALFKFCVGFNLFAALIAGPWMLYNPASWKENNVQLGLSLGDPEASLRALPMDSLHTRFTGAAVLVCGVITCVLHLQETSRQLLVLSTAWMWLSTVVTWLHHRETGLKYILPLCGAAAFHALTYSFFLASAMVERKTKKV